MLGICRWCDRCVSPFDPLDGASRSYLGGRRTHASGRRVDHPLPPLATSAWREFLMCGLAGAVFNKRDVRVQLGRALHLLRHRGPDGTQVWSDGFAWLGHTRLRILDTTSAADQPMVSQDGRGVLIYNG